MEHTFIHRELKIIVGIATAGRREQLTLTLKQLRRQHRRPDAVVVCPATLEDCDDQAYATLPFPVKVVHGPRGLPAQRNRIVDACSDADVIIFFDDDFYPYPDYLAEVEWLITSQPDVVIATGHVLADGILGPGSGSHRGSRAGGERAGYEGGEEKGNRFAGRTAARKGGSQECLTPERSFRAC